MLFEIVKSNKSNKSKIDISIKSIELEDTKEAFINSGILSVSKIQYIKQELSKIFEGEFHNVFNSNFYYLFSMLIIGKNNCFCNFFIEYNSKNKTLISSFSDEGILSKNQSDYILNKLYKNWININKLFNNEVLQ